MLSIIIPTNNNSRSIKDLVDSLPGSFDPDLLSEIIVVDDHSTDNTIDIVRKNFPSVIVLINENKGRAAALNTALAATMGKYVTYLDPGCTPGKHFYDAKIDRLEKDTNCDASYGAYKSAEISRAIYPLYAEGNRYAREHLVNYFSGTYMPQSAVVWRRDFLFRRKGHSEELLTNCDEELFVRSIFNGLRITAIKDGSVISISSEIQGAHSAVLMKNTDHLRELLKTRKKMFADLRKYSFEEDDCFLALGTFLFNCWKDLRSAQPDLAIDFLEFGKRVCWPVPVQGGLAYKALARLLGPVRATEIFYPLPK